MIEAAGWIGALLILCAYFLISSGRLTARSPLFQAMNLVGAAGFIVNGAYHGALPNAALNVVWMLIAGVMLWRIRTAKAPPERRD